MSFVGKTLKGNPKQLTRADILITQGANPKVKLEETRCDEYNLSIKFISLACPNVNNGDYNVDITISSLGKLNTLRGIASVDKNCNIKVYVFGKYDLVIGFPPVPFPLPPLIENVLVDGKLTFTKVNKKCEYVISGDLNLSLNLTLGNVNIDTNVVALAKEGKFKF